MTDWVLGLGGSSHDYSAALMRDGDIVVAIEEERLTRVKYGLSHGFRNPCELSVQYCLDYAGISRRDLSRVVSSDLLPFRARTYFEEIGLDLFSHHLSHAASAWMMTEQSSGVVLVYDGLGSVLQHPSADMRVKRETFSCYSASGSNIEALGTTYGEGFVEQSMFSMGFTNSVGQLYEIINMALGFGGLESGKTMGLASWGKPTYLDLFMEHMSYGDSLASVFNFDPFNGFVVQVEDAIRRDPSMVNKANLAATVQEVLNNTLLRAFDLAVSAAGDPAVVAIAGGCGLNTVGNGLLAKQLRVDQRLVIPPHAGDAGLSFGSLYLHAAKNGYASEVSFRGGPIAPAMSRPGKPYEKPDIARLANQHYPDLVVEPGETSPEQLAQRLADGEIIAVFEGSSEFGPRALGGRSILADPRTSATRERINREIKFREPFRPLAPLVLESQFDAYFAPRQTADPYMLKVSDASERCRDEAPAIVHIDGGARVQAVQDDESFLARILLEFYRITGVPILVNTSFNRRGEPIVETPDEAVAAFADMELDALWLFGSLITHVSTRPA